MNREREIPVLTPLQQLEQVDYLDPAQKRFATRCLIWGKLSIEKIRNRATFLPEFGNFKTALHEVGHKIMAKTKGWYVPFISTIRRGNILGITFLSPDPTKSDEQIDQDSIAISHGGEAAENLLGYKSYGSGSDHSKARARAYRLSIIHGGLASPGSYDSAGASDAHQTIASRGVNSVEEEAFYLHVKREEAA